jgi:hypothetical protein
VSIITGCPDAEILEGPLSVMEVIDSEKDKLVDEE